MAGNRWIRLDVDYFTNPKILEAGRDGRDLHLASICYAGRYLTDGIIPAQAVPALAREAGVKPHAVELVIGAGLWIPNGSSTFELHDYLEIGNPSRAEIEAERASWRDRQARARARQRHGESHP